ncbi:MAG: hypothetical protein AAGA56_07530 [Myxococcota bacterium]
MFASFDVNAPRGAAGRVTDELERLGRPAVRLPEWLPKNAAALKALE